MGALLRGPRRFWMAAGALLLLLGVVVLLFAIRGSSAGSDHGPAGRCRAMQRVGCLLLVSIGAVPAIGLGTR